MGIHITDFLNAFSTDPKYGMHLPVFWTVNIGGVDSNTVTSIVNKGHPRKWESTITPDDMTVDGNILVAQSITLPTESSGFSPMMTGNAMGGYLPPYAMDSRSNFLERSFSINFIETETDIIHEFFRPWMIAIGIKGLIEDGTTNLKATMEVIQWSNGDPRTTDGLQKQLRGFKFTKVFPTAVEGYNLDYANTDFPIKSVTFACEDYEQIKIIETSKPQGKSTPLNTTPEIIAEK